MIVRPEQANKKDLKNLNLLQIMGETILVHKLAMQEQDKNVLVRISLCTTQNPYDLKLSIKQAAALKKKLEIKMNSINKGDLIILLEISFTSSSLKSVIIRLSFSSLLIDSKVILLLSKLLLSITIRDQVNSLDNYFIDSLFPLIIALKNYLKQGWICGGSLRMKQTIAVMIIVQVPKNKQKIGNLFETVHSKKLSQISPFMTTKFSP